MIPLGLNGGVEEVYIRKVFLLEERYFKGKTFIFDLAKYPRALFLFQSTMKIVISLNL